MAIDKKTSARLGLLEVKVSGTVRDIFVDYYTETTRDIVQNPILETDTLDGQTLSPNGKTFFINNTANPEQTGIYTVISAMPFVFGRTSDFVTFDKIDQARINIFSGTYSGLSYLTTTTKPYTVGVTPIFVEKTSEIITDLSSNKVDKITGDVDTVLTLATDGGIKKTTKKFNDDGVTNNDILSANATITAINQAFLNTPSLPNVDFATTANDTLIGLAARDGFTPVNNSICLVKNQTTQSNNGIWFASSTAWTRAAYDEQTKAYKKVTTETKYGELKIQRGVVNVLNGTVNKNLQFQITVQNEAAEFGNSNVFCLATTKLPVSSVFNRFVDSTIGNDTNNNGSQPFPFATIQAALTGASYPLTVNLTGASFSAPSAFTSGQSNITIQGNDTKDLSGKTIITTGFATSSGFTRMALNTLNIFSGASPCVTFASGDLGRHDFEDVYFTTTGNSILSIPSNFSNWIYLKNTSSENSPTASLVLPDLVGTTASLSIMGARTVLNIGSIGSGWVVNISPDVPITSVAIGTVSASAVVNDMRGPAKIQGFVSDQTSLNTLVASTSAATTGLYICSFASPSIAGVTLAKGDLFYKGVTSGVPFCYKIALYDSLKGVTLGNGQAAANYVKIGSGDWVKPLAQTVAELPKFGLNVRQAGTRTWAFIYKKDIFASGYGTNDTAWGGALRTLTPRAMGIINTGASFDSWSDIFYTRYNIIALTNTGRVFEAGTRLSTVQLKEVTFPTGTGKITGIFGASVFGGSASTEDSFFALSETGKLYGWGFNGWGQLGQNNITAATNPVQITLGGLGAETVVDFKASSSLGMHVGALTSTGNLYLWGYGGTVAGANAVGNSSLAANANQLTPLSTMSGVKSFFLIGDYDNVTPRGRNCTRVIKTDGSSWAVGDGSKGQLGNNSTTSSAVWVREALNLNTWGDFFASGGTAQGGAWGLVETNGYLRFCGFSNDQCFGDLLGAISKTTFSTNATMAAYPFQNKLTYTAGVDFCKPKGALVGTVSLGYNTVYILDNTGKMYSCGWGGSGEIATGNTQNALQVFAPILTVPERRIIDFICVGTPGNNTDRGLIVLLEDGTICAAGRNDTGALSLEFANGGNIFNYLTPINWIKP